MSLTSPRRRRTIVNLAICLLSIFIFLVLMEMGLRVSKIEPGLGTPKGLYVKDDKTGTKLAPLFTGMIVEREYRVRVRINTNGFRSDHDHLREKKPAVRRIAVLGDSFTFGAGANNGETFPDFLQSELGDRYEVINMGVGGYGTVHEALFLKHYGLEYQPDIVLLTVFMGNDIVDNNRRVSRKEGRPAIPSFSSRLRNVVRELHTYQFLARRLYALLTAVGVRDYYGGKMQYDYMMVKKFSPEVEKGFKNTKRDFETIKRICDEKKTRLIAILVPIKDQVVETNWNRLANLHPLYDRDQAQKVLKGILKEMSIESFDLLPVMRAAENRSAFYHQKDPHCTVEGYRFVGEAIAQYLLRSERGEVG